MTFRVGDKVTIKKQYLGASHEELGRIYPVEDTRYPGYDGHDVIKVNGSWWYANVWTEVRYGFSLSELE